MREASSTTSPGERSSIFTPICESSVRIVRTSLSRGTCVSVNGSDVSSDAQRIGSAAFLAPDTGISPRSRRPPSMTSLSTGTAGRAGRSAGARPARAGAAGASRMRVSMARASRRNLRAERADSGLAGGEFGQTPGGHPATPAPRATRRA